MFANLFFSSFTMIFLLYSSSTVVSDEWWDHPDVQSDESDFWSNGSLTGLCELDVYPIIKFNNY